MIVPHKAPLLPRAAPVASAAMLEMAKAVHDAVVERLPDHLTKALQPHLRNMESSVAMLAGKSFEREYDSRMTQLAKHYDARLSDMKAHYEARLGDLHAMHQQNWEQVAALLKALPIPQISVPEGAISVNVQQLPATFHLPENAIQVNVKAEAAQVLFNPSIHVPEQPPATINVSVPEQAPPTINVSVPEQQSIVNVSVPEHAFKLSLNQPPATVNVTVPKNAIQIGSKITVAQPKRRTKVEKSIVYGPTGRPEKVVEETTEEDEN